MSDSHGAVYHNSLGSLIPKTQAYNYIGGGGSSVVPPPSENNNLPSIASIKSIADSYCREQVVNIAA